MFRRSFIQSIAALSVAALPTLPSLGSLTRPSKKVESVFDLFRTIETNDRLDQYHMHDCAIGELWIPFHEYKQKVDWKIDTDWSNPKRCFDLLNSSMDKAYEYDLLKIMLCAGVDRGLIFNNIHSLKDHVIFGSLELKEKHPELDIIEIDELGKDQMFQKYYDKELNGVSCGEIAIAVKPDPDVFLTFQPKAGVRQYGYNVDLEIRDGKISWKLDSGRSKDVDYTSCISTLQVSGSAILDNRNVHIISVDLIGDGICDS